VIPIINPRDDDCEPQGRCAIDRAFYYIYTDLQRAVANDDDTMHTSKLMETMEVAVFQKKKSIWFGHMELHYLL